MLGSRTAPSKARPVPQRRKEATRQLDTATRPFLVLAAMVLFAAALIARLVFWQVLQHPQLSAMALAEHADLAVQPAPRGEIVDTHGNQLASNVTMYLVYDKPREIKEPWRTAVLMARPLHQTPHQVYDTITHNDGFTLMAPALTARQGQAVRNLALPGIILDQVTRRVYPEGSIASQVLGYADITNLQGQGGIEQYYDHLLAGTAGLRSIVKDTAGNDVKVGPVSPTPAHNGANLQLSLDTNIQGLVEDELHKAVTLHHADGGTIIVMDPRTGYILAMASTPSFNPNRYWIAAGKDPSALQNPAVQTEYEPGSTMKIITMAAGLDTHMITPQSAFDDTGVFQVANVAIHNWNLQGFGWENMTQVLQHSANVGASWVAQRLGVQRFYEYIHRFRFGQPTGVDLPGELPGSLPLPGDKSWSIVNLYTNSFGQGIAVTPMQLITAVAAVANHGIMMKPQIVTKMVYDGRIIRHPPISEGRVISARTSHTLSNMLVHSAFDGEAQAALVKGYNIAAKTGTSNVPNGHGGYLNNVTIGSTIAWAPAFHPRFIALVIINHPRDTIWGSETAAPVIHNLFRELFMYDHIPPNPHALDK